MCGGGRVQCRKSGDRRSPFPGGAERFPPLINGANTGAPGRPCQSWVKTLASTAKRLILRVVVLGNSSSRRVKRFTRL